VVFNTLPFQSKQSSTTCKPRHVEEPNTHQIYATLQRIVDIVSDIFTDIFTDILCSSHIVAVAIEEDNPNPTNPKFSNMDYRLIAIT
jgi:hypothetical protein